jgi:hypothetical protein
MKDARRIRRLAAGILKGLELSSGIFSLPRKVANIINHPKNVIPQRSRVVVISLHI